MSQFRNVCFTLNNPAENGTELIERLKVFGRVKYAVVQLERGASGTPHFQGYLEFKSPVRLPALQALLPGGHFEARRGSSEQASNYCKKDEGREDGPWEFGEMSQQGQRNDLARFVENLRADGLDAARAVDPVTFIKYTAGIMRFRCVVARQQGRRDPPRVLLMYGPPGCGKTRFFYDTFAEGVSVPCASGFWFDGYEGQDAVLLDDFDGRASHWTLSNTLRVLDRYYVELPIKGGFTSWTPKTIVITTNVHPKQWFDFTNREPQFGALMRRITEVHWWKRSEQSLPVIVGQDGILWDHFCRGPMFNRVEIGENRFRFEPSGDVFDF